MNNMFSQQHLLDCSTLSATDLRKRYRPEANTHRNMLQRAASHGKVIHPDFRVFRDFLARVGPRPCPGATLDRIDNSDPEYAPGKVRWADKRTQNSNKGDTLVFYYSRTGDTYTTSRLAASRKVSPSAIRKRKERGWTDDEIIEGKRRSTQVNANNSPPSSAPREKRAPITPRPAPGFRLCRDILWERREASVAHTRAEEGQEYCVADYETLTDGAINIPVENYERHFAKWWAEWKPHLIRENLPTWAQTLIAKIESNGEPVTPAYMQLIAKYEARRKKRSDAWSDAQKALARTNKNSPSSSERDEEVDYDIRGHVLFQTGKPGRFDRLLGIRRLR